MKQRSQWLSVMGVSFCCCLFFTQGLVGLLVVRAEGIPVWLCKAEGTYSACPATRSWRPCQDRRLEGIGVASDKTTACMEAERSCADNLLRTLLLENQQGNASIKSRCAPTACELGSIGEVVPRMLSHAN